MTAKQVKFANEYLVDFNATRAAIAAGYSKKTASEMGYENLNKPHIKDYIKKNKVDTSKKLVITRETQLRKLNTFHKLPIKQYGNLVLQAITIQNRMLGFEVEPTGKNQIQNQINILVQNFNGGNAKD